MTSAWIYLHNDHPTDLHSATDSNNIANMPDKPVIPGFSSSTTEVETDGIEQSWFAIGDGGNGWAKFDLGGGIYRTGYDDSGNESTFRFFEANTDRISSVFGPVANFIYCWGPQILTPLIQEAIEANLPAAIDWLNQGQSIDIGSVSLTINSISQNAQVSCYYAAVTPQDDNSFILRLMFSLSKTSVSATINGVDATITADPIYVYLDATVSYPLDTNGSLNLSASGNTLQFSTPGWNVDCTDVEVLSALLLVVLGPIEGAIVDLEINNLLSSSAENWLNQDPINSALLTAMNNAISSAISSQFSTGE